MSAKRESRQPVPSVMARLMGLDEIPPQQPFQKRARVLSENYLQRVSSVGVREKCSERYLFRFSVEEQDECKNVVQVLETLRRNKHHSIPVRKRKVHSGSPEVKMEVIETKHVAGIDSETDNILKYLQKPNLQFTKKFDEPNDFHSNLKSGHFAVLQSSCASECRNISMCRKFRKKSEQGYVNSVKKVQNSLGIYSSGEPHVDDMNKFLRSKFKSNNKSCLPTTRIVFLKPNLGKADSIARCFSLSSQPHKVSELGDENQNETLSPQHGSLYVGVKDRKTLENGFRPVRRSRFLRETTRKVVRGTSSLPTEEPRSEISGNGLFSKESESIIPSSPTLSDRKSQYYCSDGSYVAREAKKQISERWKTSKRFQHDELAGKSETLGEMLLSLEKPGKYDLSKQGAPDNGDVNLSSPSGISSWDGWNNECVRDLARSRSLLAYFNAVASPNSRTSHESFDNCQNKSQDQDFNLKYGSECRSSDASYKKSQAIPHLESEDLPELNFVVSKSSMRNAFSNSMEVDAETEVVKMSPSNHMEHQLESRNCFLSTKEEDSSVKQEISNGIFEEDSVSSQCSGTDPDSLMSFEEAYQPSPNSVLESLYKKEISSSSDCFKSVNTSLHGLHMQLELLKSETSEVYSEGSSMMVSSDEDTGEGSVNDLEENEGLMRSFRVESRDFSYLVDVLTEAGFHNRNLHVGFDTWNSQECPISYSIFETLEKKYGEQISWKRSERRLLFDRINSGLIEILQPSMCVQTGTKPVARRLSYSQGQDVIEEELWMLLFSQEKEANKESEKILGKDDGWLELRDDIQDIGREIENSLIDELVIDVSMEIF